MYVSSYRMANLLRKKEKTEEIRTRWNLIEWFFFVITFYIILTFDYIYV